jgi:hypothetical protein
MSRIEGPPYAGALGFDLSGVAGDLYDIKPGGLQGARGAGDPAELDPVVAELTNALPKYGDALEIHPNVLKRIVGAAGKIQTLGDAEVVLRKLLEVVVESRTRLVNNREEDIAEVGTKAEKAGTKGKQPDMLSHFGLTIRYKSRIADKSVETRKKHEEAKNAAPAAPTPDPAKPNG